MSEEEAAAVEPMVVYGKAQLLAAILAVGSELETIELRRKRDDKLITTYCLKEGRLLGGYGFGRLRRKRLIPNIKVFAQNLRRLPAHIFTGEEKP